MLVVSASAGEMAAFEAALASIRGPAARRVSRLVCGVGPVEAAFRLTRFLAEARQAGALPEAVLNIGIAGAYRRNSGQGADEAQVLDICLAESELLGDLGKMDGRGRFFPIAVPVETDFPLDAALREELRARLEQSGVIPRCGAFVTVSCASGDRVRGERILARAPHALCENMEGAALALVCRHYRIPFAELRCVSNRVDDPAAQNWRLKEACRRCGRVAAGLFLEQSKEQSKEQS